MRVAARTFFALHAMAMILGLVGILVMIPHPQLWAGDPHAAAFYTFAIDRTGGSSMVLGALAMLAWGAYALGVRKTLVFFAIATVVSASAELTGTKTGWPFGGYEYLSFLGYKLLGRVPYSIPLSWFYMGFASYALADIALARRGMVRRAWWSIVLGAWLLTAWDLVLDPAMASPSLAYLHFWQWHETGQYFGMPLRNLVGWFGTGAAFIALARFAWRREPDGARIGAVFPFAVYVLNVGWSMGISVAAGLWPTAVAATLLAIVPATLALRPATVRRDAEGRRLANV